MQGGCFLYPCDKKYTAGRLRLVYEAIPLSFVWENCGGTAFATTEGQRIMDVPFPHKDVHARCGVIMLGPEEASVFAKTKDSVQ